MNRLAAQTFAVLICVASTLFGQTKPTTAPAEYSRSEVTYGRKDGAALTMDIMVPKGHRNGAAVIIVVSGGWYSSHDAITPQYIEMFG